MGDGLLLRSFRDHPTADLKLDYGAPKDRQSYHLALWLGIWKEGSASVDERLNALGWVFDTARAAAAIEARRAATTGAVEDESAIPTGAAHE